MKKEFISPNGVKGAYETVGCVPAVKVGNTIYLSGRTGRDEQRKIVEGGFEAQAVKTLENLKLTLEAAGASLKDVVKLTVYLTNTDDIPKLVKTMDRFFGSPLPANSAVGVVRLHAPEALVEIEAVAVTD